MRPPCQTFGIDRDHRPHADRSAGFRDRAADRSQYGRTAPRTNGRLEQLVLEHRSDRRQLPQRHHNPPVFRSTKSHLLPQRSTKTTTLPYGSSRGSWINSIPRAFIAL